MPSASWGPVWGLTKGLLGAHRQVSNSLKPLCSQGPRAAAQQLPCFRGAHRQCPHPRGLGGEPGARPVSHGSAETRAGSRHLYPSVAVTGTPTSPVALRRPRSPGPSCHLPLPCGSGGSSNKALLSLPLEGSGGPSGSQTPPHPVGARGSLPGAGASPQDTSPSTSPGRKGRAASRQSAGGSAGTEFRSGGISRVI